MIAKQVIYEGIHFRSKLEARWYIFMKKLGWNIIYEPEIEGLTGWLPDFLIIGKGFKTLVDVKPIDSEEEWEDSFFDYSKNDVEKIIRKTHKDYNKIMNSGIKNLPEYELLILGSNLRLDGKNGFGVLYERFEKHDYDPKTNTHTHTDMKNIEKTAECMFVESKNRVGFFSYEQSWACKITGDGGKLYKFRENDSDKDFFKKIDTMWNQAWSELRWKGKEVA